MAKVYVVSWEYDSGGGFEWYHNESDARKALDKEKDDLTWRSVSFYEFNSISSIPEEITHEIDAQDWSELHDKNIIGRILRKSIEHTSHLLILFITKKKMYMIGQTMILIQ